MGLLAGIEMGGTKVVCAVSADGRHALAEAHLPTSRDPAATMRKAGESLLDMARGRGGIDAVGVGAFGPCDPDATSPTYGYITTTPKPGWQGADVLGMLREVVGPIPVGFDTDVNAAALGELRYGAGVGRSSLVYLTVGTGIGGGAVVGGRLVHGLTHPEMGHMMVRRSPAEVPGFRGVCPYHGDCLEGLAAGPALSARWKAPGQDLPSDHPAWDVESDYLADALAAIVYILSPQRIVLGGGVGLAPGLAERVRPKLITVLAGYLDHPALANDARGYVVRAELAHQAGAVGTFCLAAEALASANRGVTGRGDL